MPTPDNLVTSKHVSLHAGCLWPDCVQSRGCFLSTESTQVLACVLAQAVQKRDGCTYLEPAVANSSAIAE